MRKRLAVLLVAAILASACSDTADDSPRVTADGTQSPAATRPPEAAPSTTMPAAPTTLAPGSAITTVPATSAGPGFIEVRQLGIGDEYYPNLGNPGYDVLHYDLDLVFDPIANHLEATATITANATDELPTFNLDFDRLTVEVIRVDGVPADFSVADEELTIRPTEAIGRGSRFIVEVEYSGSPGPEPSEAILFKVGWMTAADGSEAFVVAEPDAAHTWFPGNDHPLDKATFSFTITVPEELIAAANGTLISAAPGDDGTTTWRWEMDDQMATYLATVVIGEFDLVPDDSASLDAGLPIRHVLPRGTTVADWPGLERQGEMVAFLAELFGPYPFDNYGIAIVDGFENALENQTLSIFGRRFTDPQFFEIVLIHELTHQWFGDSVSTGLWRDIWLNEGFASYAEWLWLEEQRSRASLESSIENERAFFADAGARPPGDPLADDLFNVSVYRVGAMTLHALRLTIGDDAFFETLQTYHLQFASGTATTADFVGVAETVSGMDLQALFEAWLYEEEIPEFP